MRLRTKVQLGMVKKMLFQLIVFHIIEMKSDLQNNEIALGLARPSLKVSSMAMNEDLVW